MTTSSRVGVAAGPKERFNGIGHPWEDRDNRAPADIVGEMRAQDVEK
jgi:hypothetical protein